MIYRVEVHGGVSDYLRDLEGFTRTGRLALYGFIDVLRNYGDEAREGCPRQTPDSTIFRLRWTFDAGAAIRSVDFYVDESLFRKWEGEAPAEPFARQIKARQEPRPPENRAFGTDSDTQGAAGLLEVLYAELVLLPE